MISNRLLSLYPGWRVLAGAFIGGALGIGFTTYIFGMFVVPVTQEFGISRSTFNNAYITYMIGNCIAGPLMGPMLDKLSIRRLMMIFGLTFGGALILVSQIDILWLMTLAMLPLAFASTVCGVVGANTVVVRWFHNRRGRALGLLSLSVSVGGIVSQPLTALLIEAFGWRDAMLMIGLFTGITLPLVALLLIRDRPNTTEPGYDTEFSTPSTDGSPAKRVQERAWPLRELLRNRNFWLLAIGVSLLFGTDAAVLVSQVAYFQDIGFELSAIALLVMVKAISAAFGKVLIGLLADKVDLRFLYAYVALSAALLLTIYSLQPSYTVLMISVALLGITVGGVYPVWTTLMAWLFGSRSYGTVMGIIATVIPFTAIVSTRFIGEVHDRTGTYIPAFITFIALVLFSIVLIFLLRPERKTDEESNDRQSALTAGNPVSAGAPD